MRVQKIDSAHRPSRGLREELIDLIRKGEGKAEKYLNGKPDALQEILETFESVREVVSLLLANPKTLTRLVHDLTVEVAQYGQSDLKNREGEERSRALLLTTARDARDQAAGIIGNSSLYPDWEKWYNNKKY
jgi:hypothetical protein